MRKTMNKEWLKKYSGQIALGVTVVTVAGTAIFSMGGKQENQNRTDVNVGIPSAGIGTVIADSSDKESGQVVGGIANVLNEYYTEQSDNKNASIVALENAISMISKNESEQNSQQQEPQNTEAQTEQTQEQSALSGDEQAFFDKYENLGVANVENYLNVRETPDTDGTLLGKLPMNAACNITETLDGWYKISSGELEGYVSADYLLTGEDAKTRALENLATVADVNADMLMVREEMNTDCTILTRVAQGEVLDVLEVLDGWVKVDIDGKQGYVSAEFVNVYKSLPVGITMSELSYGSGVSNTAVDLIEYAKQFLGNPYVYGGTSLTNGTDCSGFTMRVYEHFGYSLSRTSRSQAYDGTRVSLDELQPGDLLFYNHGSSIGHVAIYIGGGQIIHASTERTGIIIGNAFYTTPACATRILN